MVDPIVSASTGVMNSLLSKLTTLLGDEYKLLKGVRKEVRFLKDELSSMNALLQKLAGTEQLDVQAKEWRDKVRELAYDIEDCIDVFMHNLGGDGDKDGLIRKAARRIRKLRVRHQLASQIQELKARVVEAAERRDRYQVNDYASNSGVVEIDYRLPALYTEVEKLVGIDGPREEIVRLLMEGKSGSAQELKIVSIVGFGGLGKTTLALQVHNLVKNKFDCTAFVSVSRTPDMQRIMKDVLSGVGYSSMHMPEDQQKLIDVLRDYLADKRYLIIIDDLWSITAWDIIKCAFVQNKNGSRVVTTTRTHDVAIACCSHCLGRVHEMQPLNMIDSRRLFFKRLFQSEGCCPEQFKAIAEDMLRRCKGVPLAIISVASLLASQGMHVEKWEKIRNSLSSELETNRTLEWMRHVLSLSYNDLPNDLKTCLLYLAMYPEDYDIKKDELVKRWIAEGFVREKHGLELEEVAESNFNELINRSMIQPFFMFGEVFSCRVHDLMLDLIISKCIEENFITLLDRQNNIDGASHHVRRIIHQSSKGDMASIVGRMSVSQVRTYTSFPAADCMVPLSKFKLLRVLALDKGNPFTSSSMFIDLSAVSHLFLLRYLKVRAFRLKLPKKFGKLKNLMTLDLDFVTLNPQKQSTDITSLSSLRHLALPTYSVELRNGLSKLQNLRILQNFCMKQNSAECFRELGELINLRDLTLFYNWPQDDVEERPEDEKLKYGILAASLDKLVNNNLRTLTGSAFPYDSLTQFWNTSFTHPSHLLKLRLDDLIPQVPNWMAYAERLAHLDLHVQELRSDDVQILGQLPCLMFLDLIAKTIPKGTIVIIPDTYRSIKEFCLHYHELSRLTFETGSMPRLQRLRIYLNCMGPGTVQLHGGSPVAGIEHLASLEYIYVDITVNCRHYSKIELSKIVSACRDAISRHPRSHTKQISLEWAVVDENRMLLDGSRRLLQASEEQDD
ncbi:hypothetical protein ACP4OV_020141 [Aristida adscensionis]